MKNLFVIDTNPVIYRIAHICDRFNSYDTDRIFHSFDFVNTAKFLLQADSHSKVIWVGDCDDQYWRKTAYPDYKANRTPKPESFTRLKAVFQEWSLKRKVKPLTFSTYEADDVAATIVKLFIDKDIQGVRVFLSSVDSDWQGLIYDDRFAYYSFYGDPVIRQRYNIWQWLYKKHLKQSKKRQRLWEMPSLENFHPSDIWSWKACVGDRSDNLRVDSPIGLIHLLEPDKKLWEDSTLNANTLISDAISCAPVHQSDREASSHYLGIMGESPIPILNIK